jgi:hypothetical protein
MYSTKLYVSSFNNLIYNNLKALYNSKIFISKKMQDTTIKSLRGQHVISSKQFNRKLTEVLFSINPIDFIKKV